MSKKGVVNRRAGASTKSASLDTVSVGKPVSEKKSSVKANNNVKQPIARSSASILYMVLSIVVVLVSGSVWMLLKDTSATLLYPPANFNITAVPEYTYDRTYVLSEVADVANGPLKILDSFVLDWPAMKWTKDVLAEYMNGAKRRVSNHPIFPAMPQRKPLSGNSTYAGKDDSVVYTPLKTLLTNTPLQPYTHITSSLKASALQNSLGFTPKYIADVLLPSLTELYSPNSTIAEMERVLDLRDQLEAQNMNVHPTYYGSWREFAPKVQGEKRDVHILSRDSVLPLQMDQRNRYFVVLQGSMQAHVVKPTHVTAFAPHPWISSYAGYFQSTWTNVTSTGMNILTTVLHAGQVLSIPDSHAVELHALKDTIFLELGSYSKYKRIFEDTMQKWMMNTEATWSQRQRITVAGFAFQNWMHNLYVLEKLQLAQFPVTMEKEDFSAFENNPEYIPITTIDGRLITYVPKNTTKVNQIKERTKSRHSFQNVTIPQIAKTERVRDVVKNPSLAFYDTYLFPMYNPQYNNMMPIEPALFDPKIHPHTDRNAASISREINMDGTRVPTLVWLNEYAYCNMTSDQVTTGRGTLKQQMDMATKFGFMREGAPEPDQKYLTTPQMLVGLNSELRTYVDLFKALPESSYAQYLAEAFERIAYWATNEEHIDGTSVPKALICMAINLLDF